MEIRSASYSKYDDVIKVGENKVRLYDSCLKESWDYELEQPPISVCMDEKFGYAICNDNFIRKFDLGTARTIHKWPIPINAPFHHQMVVINEKVYYCNVKKNEIIIFSSTKESPLKESIMSLRALDKPAYIADNTKHEKETVIIAGSSSVGKFPIMRGYCQATWCITVENARGISVDARGLIYVAKCHPSEIYLLSQKRGKSRDLL